MEAVKKCFKLLVLFFIGGTLYVCIEFLWRGYSHISMFFLGGICFVLVGEINELFPWELGFIWQCLIGALVITAAELVTGLVVNMWLGLNVWDYSGLPGNVLGQICPQFSLLWVLLSGIAIVLDDYLRYWLFGEEKPHYKFA